MARYLDLLITGGDLTLDPANEPIITSEAFSIGQDLKHAIIESGLAEHFIAERSPTMRIDLINQIELLAEKDKRIIPGTVNITEESKERLFLTAKAYDIEEMITIGVMNAE